MYPSQNVACAAIITRPSSSNFLEDNRLRPCDRSPIRTLSEDRVHVSLRLGPLFSEEEKEDEDIGDDIPQMMERAPSKAEGKRIAGSTQDHKRALRNNSHGVAVKRRRVTKKNSSPRRSSPLKKLMADAIRTGTRTSLRRKNTAAPRR